MTEVSGDRRYGLAEVPHPLFHVLDPLEVPGERGKVGSARHSELL
jgi:hypothetical protein